jgi:hypothetical protein
MIEEMIERLFLHNVWDGVAEVIADEHGVSNINY